MGFYIRNEPLLVTKGHAMAYNEPYLDQGQRPYFDDEELVRFSKVFGVSESSLDLSARRTAESREFQQEAGLIPRTDSKYQPVRGSEYDQRKTRENAEYEKLAAQERFRQEQEAKRVIAREELRSRYTAYRDISANELNDALLNRMKAEDYQQQRLQTAERMAPPGTNVALGYRGGKGVEVRRWSGSGWAPRGTELYERDQAAARERTRRAFSMLGGSQTDTQMVGRADAPTDYKVAADAGRARLRENILKGGGITTLGDLEKLVEETAGDSPIKGALWAEAESILSSGKPELFERLVGEKMTRRAHEATDKTNWAIVASAMRGLRPDEYKGMSDEEAYKHTWNTPRLKQLYDTTVGKRMVTGLKDPVSSFDPEQMLRFADKGSAVLDTPDARNIAMGDTTVGAELDKLRTQYALDAQQDPAKAAIAFQGGMTQLMHFYNRTINVVDAARQIGNYAQIAVSRPQSLKGNKAAYPAAVAYGALSGGDERTRRKIEDAMIYAFPEVPDIGTGETIYDDSIRQRLIQGVADVLRVNGDDIDKATREIHDLVAGTISGGAFAIGSGEDAREFARDVLSGASAELKGFLQETGKNDARMSVADVQSQIGGLVKMEPTDWVEAVQSTTGVLAGKEMSGSDAELVSYFDVSGGEGIDTYDEQAALVIARRFPALRGILRSFVAGDDGGTLDDNMKSILKAQLGAVKTKLESQALVEREARGVKLREFYRDNPVSYLLDVESKTAGPASTLIGWDPQYPERHVKTRGQGSSKKTYAFANAELAAMSDGWTTEQLDAVESVLPGRFIGEFASEQEMKEVASVMSGVDSVLYPAHSKKLLGQKDAVDAGLIKGQTKKLALATKVNRGDPQNIEVPKGEVPDFMQAAYENDPVTRSLWNEAINAGIKQDRRRSQQLASLAVITARKYAVSQSDVSLMGLGKDALDVIGRRLADVGVNDLSSKGTLEAINNMDPGDAREIYPEVKASLDAHNKAIKNVVATQEATGRDMSDRLKPLIATRDNLASVVDALDKRFETNWERASREVVEERERVKARLRDQPPRSEADKVIRKIFRGKSFRGELAEKIALKIGYDIADAATWTTDQIDRFTLALWEWGEREEDFGEPGE